MPAECGCTAARLHHAWRLIPDDLYVQRKQKRKRKRKRTAESIECSSCTQSYVPLQRGWPMAGQSSFPPFPFLSLTNTLFGASRAKTHAGCPVALPLCVWRTPGSHPRPCSTQGARSDRWRRVRHGCCFRPKEGGAGRRGLGQQRTEGGDVGVRRQTHVWRCAVLCRAVLLAGCAERWRRRVRHGTAAGVERQGASENVPPRLRIRI